MEQLQDDLCISFDFAFTFIAFINFYGKKVKDI